MSLLATKPNHDGTDGKVLPLSFGTTDETGDNPHATRRTLPAEWFTQSLVQLTWPHQDTDWADDLEEATTCYLRMAYEIASRQRLLIVTPHKAELQQLIERQLPAAVCANIIYFEAPTNDTWARDHAFLTVIGPEGIELLDFRFNGWGGKFAADKDNAINKRLYDSGLLQGTYADHLDFEFEGGSIESDGRGTLLVTSECLLDPHRNPQYSRTDITDMLCRRFGADRVLWLDHGHLEGDDTDSHIDTLARFCPNDTILYVSCTDPSDPHYDDLRAMEEQLRTFRTTDGRPYRLLALPMARPVFAETERLPATYANFLILNSAVLYPTYADAETDAKAARILAEAFPRYDIVGIDCRVLIKQHGSLHCATMQYPKGVIRP